MTPDSIITVVGAIVTLIGTVVTIWQSAQAKSYKDQIKSDVRKLNVAHSVERLRNAQDAIRHLPTSSKAPRGVRPADTLKRIREHFDTVLGNIHATGPDANARTILVNGQNYLNAYAVSWDRGHPDVNALHKLQEAMQEGISVLNSTIYELEERP